MVTPAPRKFLGVHRCACGKRVRVYDWLPESPKCSSCAREEAARTAEPKRRGRPPLDLPRECSICGDDVVRPGVLRPKPLCARCYFRERRAKNPKAAAPRVRVVRVRLPGDDFDRLVRLGDRSEIATRLVWLIATGLAVVDLAPEGEPVRGSAPKEGAP